MNACKHCDTPCQACVCHTHASAPAGATPAWLPGCLLIHSIHTLDTCSLFISLQFSVHISLTCSVLAIVLGGGSGDKLFPLTKRRSEPAIMFSGAYRLIDVPLSNALNSGIRKVGPPPHE